MSNDLVLVAYPDGGCAGDARNAGAGMHGYFYKPSAVSDVKCTEQTKSGAITTLGYIYELNRKRFVQEKACIVKPEEYIDFILPIPAATNNIAELSGAIRALEIALERQVARVYIWSDSRYVVDNHNQGHAAKWRNNNWCTSTGKPAENIELWQRLLELSAQVQAAGIELQLDWVKGHSDNLGNDRADLLATSGILLANRGKIAPRETASPVAGYNNYRADYNRLFSHSRWYWRTKSPEEICPLTGKYVYHCGKHGPDDALWGKPMSDAAQSILLLAQPDPVLRVVRENQNLIDDDVVGNQIICYLDQVFNAKTYSEIQKTGSDYIFTNSPTRRHTFFLGGSSLTREHKPPKMAWLAENTFTILRGVLEEYIASKTLSAEQKAARGKKGLCVTDITELLYVTDTSKKKPVRKLSDLVDQTTRSIDVDVDYNVTGTPGRARITLTLDLGIPKRNTLSAIATDDPKVLVVTWRESEHGFRYATIVEVGEDLGIWTSYHTHLRAIV